ncbi:MULTISPECIES: SCO family protein [unclassified Paracoccus (in: a-proteobacteria)]|uniref:SCO family protein n=1 Tax=unclassified Paracoccus (in: a-proteobacteria) TaxID=2688777 RepID=UPI001602BC0E|nr:MULTISPECIES: SCO family protein [unclassified Paracoccus (in: a-proteobacteria)]MBB1492078.1 SCO family protein [Paracoccus sp. MC1854]MBB1497964.1 SCO family protein [Paracoccus sp. MC1862]QQO44348.1 SCO family protein [Paracoccus sp. MC1862]
MTERRLMMLGLLATVLVLLTGWLWLRPASGDQFAQCRRSNVAGGIEALGGSFILTDENGARVTDAQVFDRPSIFYMGYTYCPDVCPMDSARNAGAADILSERGMSVKPVFMSVDPARDTPEQLRDFTDAMHPDMLGITGSVEEVTAVSRAWRGYFRLNDEEDKESYLVDHTTNSFLVLPGHGTVEFFTRDTSPEQMADQIACFVEAA